METIEPAAISAELLDHDDGTDAVQVVPPVVAVVVTHDPGPWLEECLSALAAQDYPALSVLVLDDGSADDLTSRVAATMPHAFVRRRAADIARDTGGGASFAAAANEALAAVEGAMFLLFCHDDVSLDPDAVRVMVEEAYRSNAGIVGPKVVEHDHPDRLIEVGMAIDHYGVPFSGIEPDEVDQEQHDGVRDVFYVSHTTMLVRTDLFHELDGFDPETFPGADDLDVCWRARLAGARVIVAPSARALHRQVHPSDTRARRDTPAHALRMETRSRVRVLLKSYSAVALVWVVPTAFVLDVGEAVALVLTGQIRRAGALLGGWFSVLAHPGELRRARHAAQSLRRVEDHDVRHLMIRGSARVRAFFVQRMHAGDRFADASNRARSRMSDVGTRLRRAPAIIGIALGVLLVAGARALLFGRVPEVGTFRVWPGMGASWATFTASWRETFMGRGTAATPAFALMSSLTAALFGHAGLARSLVIGGALLFGAFGAYRLVRPFGSSTLPALAGAVAYAANPVARNAIAWGAFGPLVFFALAPFMLGAFARVVDRDTTTRQRTHHALTLVLLSTICGAVWPAALLLSAALGVACLLAWPFVDDTRAMLRALVLGFGGAAAAVLLLAPWSLSLFGADRATLGALPRSPLTLADVLRFHTATAGHGLAPFGLLAAAAVPLAIARGARLVWAMRAWSLVVVSFLLAWLPGRIAPGHAMLAPEGVLVGAAVGLAFAAGLGVAALVDDLRRFHFGWRQITIVVGVAGLAVSVLGLAADSIDGRYGLPTTDWPQTYSWMSDNPPPGGFRVLWVGDPAILPADAKVTGSIGYATTRDGTGDARAVWAAPESHADAALGTALQTAASGSTARLGHLLAPAGIRYIAFVTRLAPDAKAIAGHDQSALGSALARQLDLTLSRNDDSGVVYENDAWMPARSLVSPASASAVHDDQSDPLRAAVRTEGATVQGVAAKGGVTPPIGPGTLLWSEAASSRWRATVGGHAVPHHAAFGWTNGYTLAANAPVRVAYNASPWTGLARALEILGAIGVLLAWIATRRGSGAAPEPGAKVVVDLAAEDRADVEASAIR